MSSTKTLNFIAGWPLQNMDRNKHVQALLILIVFCLSSQLTVAEDESENPCLHSQHKRSHHQQSINPNSDKCRQSVEPIQWADLTLRQQEWLAKLEAVWGDMPPHKQRRLSNIAARWEHASPELRKKMVARREHWEQRKPKDRHFIRQKFDRFKSLDAKQQQALMKAFEKFKALSPEEKRELRKHWRTLSKEERIKSRLDIMGERGKP